MNEDYIKFIGLSLLSNIDFYNSLSRRQSEIEKPKEDIEDRIRRKIRAKNERNRK